jgi:hypothetical protein
LLWRFLGVALSWRGVFTAKLGRAGVARTADFALRQAERIFAMLACTPKPPGAAEEVVKPVPQSQGQDFGKTSK